MRFAQAVIGANYGDEGKGLVVDYLVSRAPDQADTIVVRANGGAQAGHTVRHGSKQHTFHHFGSGTFLGVRTFLSNHFVVNPMLFWKEKKQLDQLNVRVAPLFIDPRAVITTPWDIMANQARERVAPLGSCGVGVRDTMERNEHSLHGLTVGEVVGLFSTNPLCLYSKLEAIRDVWLPEYLIENRVPADLIETESRIAVTERFFNDLRDFTNAVTLITPGSLHKNGYEHFIFENSQGLGLDQNYGTVPNVTRSNTGLKNILEVCKEAEIDGLEVYYTTRAYLTRHGIGYMESEITQADLVDAWKGHQTMAHVLKQAATDANVENEFQGKMRFGYLDALSLQARIKRDLQQARTWNEFYPNIKVIPQLAVTCLDHLDLKGNYFIASKLEGCEKDRFAKQLAREIGLTNVLESWGPTRDTVKEGLVL